jgi:hypothetical protein
MGYGMEQTNGRFQIAADKLDDVFNAIQALMSKGSCEPNGEFHWVNTRTVMQARSLREQLMAWRWSTLFDDAGNITGLQFTCERYGDDIKLFKAIAPWVERGSYLDMLGEEGDHWRWYFDGITCEELNGMVQFAAPADGDILEGDAREVLDPKALATPVKRLT